MGRTSGYRTLLCLVGGFGLWQLAAQQFVWVSPDYQPPVQVEALASATTMTDRARRILYSTEPQIKPRQEFPAKCQEKTKAIMLGCYSSTNQIFVQDIREPRLKGVMEVTIAHEMLHAAYEKHISVWDRYWLNQHLQAAYDRLKRLKDAQDLKDKDLKDKDLKDKDLKDHVILRQLEAYHLDESDPKDQVTLYHELHSLLGTELQDLNDPELEDYYQRYFQQRGAIVAFSQKYEGVFETLRAKRQKLQGELETMDVSLKDLKASVEKQADQIKILSEDLEALKTEVMDLKNDAERQAPIGSISTALIDAFEAKKADFNQRVTAYNSLIEDHRQLVATLNQKADSYNQKVKSLNQLATENNDLVEALENSKVP
jgi:hypothetical protein